MNSCLYIGKTLNQPGVCFFNYILELAGTLENERCSIFLEGAVSIFQSFPLYSSVSAPKSRTSLKLMI